MTTDSDRSQERAWGAFERGDSAEAWRLLEDLLSDDSPTPSARLLKLALAMERSVPPGASHRAQALARRALADGDATSAVRGWLLAARQARGRGRRAFLEEAAAVDITHAGLRVARAHEIAREALDDGDPERARARLDEVRDDIGKVEAHLVVAHRGFRRELRELTPGDASLAPEEAHPRLVAVTLALAQQRDPEGVCELVARTVHDVLDVDRACVVLIEGEGHRVVAEFPDVGRPMSQATLQRCLEHGEEVFVENLAMEDERGAPSVIGLGVTSVLCAPLRNGAEVVGAIYADADDVAAIALGERTWVLRTLAAAAAVAVGNAQDLARERARVHAGRELAHDMRNLLGAVLGAAELLGETEPRPDQVGFIDLIVEAAGALTEQVTQALAPHRADPTPVDLSEVASRVAAMLAVEAQAEGKTIEVEGCAEGWVSGRPQELLRACTNLLTNALKYGPKGRAIELSVRRRGDRVRLSVRDHGQGVPEEDLPHVFRSGFQAGDALAGHGLGLGLVQRVIEDGGGEVGVRNEPDGGACFWFELPAVDPC